MAKDPFRFFRVEAREIVDALMQGGVKLGTAQAAELAELVRGLLRQAHTLKGAARVVKLPAIAERAHAIEDLLAPLREGGDAGPVAAPFLALVDAIRADLDAIDAPAAPAPNAAAAGATPAATPPRAAAGPRREVSRVEVGELDALLRELAEACEALRRAEQAFAELPAAVETAAQLARRGGAAAAAAADLRARLDHAARAGGAAMAAARARAGGARVRAELLRLSRVDALLPRLERAVHDACSELGKRARFAISGGEARIEAHALTAIGEALEHAVRNAVVHGIESPEVRAAAGKPADGLIELVVERRGGRIAFACSDDGAGVDCERARESAVKRGLVSAERARALNGDEAAALVLLPGVSTAASVSALAGRGVGLDVAGEAARRFGGEVRIASRPGAGATVTIEIGAALAAAPVLALEAAGERVLLPRSAVAETRRLSVEEVAQARSGSLRWGDEVVPCAPLAAVLGRQVGPAARMSALLLREAGSTPAAVLVERIAGGGEAVLDRLPAEAGGDGLAQWMALEHDGAPRVVLEPAALARTVREGSWRADAPAPREPRRVLVVDDSLTTRMLEQSILESAGYEVELASSAEEGLERARARPHALFVVDVEMPGMNGLQFVATVRGDERLRATPAILVTSLATPEHRRAGLAAGANAYIVKGEFDQGRFIATVRGLAGT